MKKLNEDVIRKLIMETLEEVSLGEGRKKKLEEADPEENPQDMADLSARAGYPPQNEPDQSVNMPTPGVEFNAEDFSRHFAGAVEMIEKALEVARKNPGVSSDTIKGLLKGLEQKLPKNN